MIARRLTVLAELTDHVQIVLSAGYASHLPQIQKALQGTPINASFELTELDHVDLIEPDHLRRQLTPAR